MIWLLQHRQALALALLRLKASPLNSLLSILAMGVALALPAGGQLLVDNGVRLARSSAPAPQISLYLRMDADSAQVAGVRERLAANRDIASSQFLSRDETLQRFKGSEGLRDVIDVLPAWIVWRSSCVPCPRSIMCSSTRIGCGDWMPCYAS